ncbi:MAG: GntR family transcriptional regulator [Frankiales bacterium]|jgi:GntR family transcriptional regulator|nr:GntR family transcriptional regulator [Frankiales bacterium]
MPDRPHRLIAKERARLLYDQQRPAPVRLNNSVRRTYDLLRVLLYSSGRDRQLVENELVDDLSASRSTVRTVLQQLADDGLVQRSRRTGTTPTRSTVFAIDQLMTFGEFSQNQRAAVQGQVLETAVISAPRLIRERLRLPEGSDVLVVESLMLWEGRAIALAVSYVGLGSGDQAPRSGEPFDGLTFVEQHLQVRVATSSSTIGAAAADAETAALLGVAEGSPLLWFEDILNDMDGNPRALCGFRFRSDQVAVTATANRWSPRPAEDPA